MTAATVWRRRLLAAALVALPGILVGTAPASAHTGLVSATPAANSTVSAVPGRVELAFTSPVQARLVQVVVEDDAGRDHVVGPVTSFDSRVVAGVEAVSPGSYLVAYRVIAPDGHPVVGQYRFTVASGAVTSASVRSAAGSGPTATDGGHRPWLVPLVGLLAVVSVVALRVAHGVRRARAS